MQHTGKENTSKCCMGVTDLRVLARSSAPCQPAQDEARQGLAIGVWRNVPCASGLLQADSERRSHSLENAVQPLAK